MAGSTTTYSFITVSPPAPILEGLPGFPLDMYRFLISPIPEADHKDGDLFLKRFLNGSNLAWQETVKNILAVPTLWSIQDIDDAYLKYLKNIIGWTEELEHITDRLDADALRRLIAASGAMWRERGPEDTIINVMRIATGGARMRIWNWFDFRWVLGETGLGEEHEGTDPWVIDFPEESRVPKFSAIIPQENAEYYSNLRIVDDGTLDRDLVKDVLNLMRAANERFEITYIDFLDLFGSPGDDLQWDVPTTLNLIVEDGRAQLLDTTQTESTTAIVSTASTWSEYVYSARIRGNSPTATAFGLWFYYQDIDNSYSVVVEPSSQTLSLQKVVGGSPTIIATVDLIAAGFPIYDDVWYVVRAEVVVEGATNRILIFIDGSQLINTTDATYNAGTVGFFHTSGATIECDEVEVMELPVDSETLEINA